MSRWIVYKFDNEVVLSLFNRLHGLEPSHGMNVFSIFNIF